MADLLPPPAGAPEPAPRERALLEAVQAGEARLLDLLHALIRFRTPNPPGGNERHA
jgi:hypothetical protein